MDGLEVVGAYLAEELTKAGVLSMNAHQTIYVITPEFNSTGQMIFRDNYEPMINGKNILILNGSITTGSTLNRAIESVLYYGGKIRGVAAIYSSVDSVASLPVHSIFQSRDIPDYHSYRSDSCPMCKNRQKIDAIVSSYGYSMLEYHHIKTLKQPPKRKPCLTTRASFSPHSTPPLRIPVIQRNTYDPSPFRPPCPNQTPVL